jgi:isopropylmalate/homocitrate/citramalate synthase
MLSDPATLEPFDPARFGGSRRLIFGERTGAGAARKLLERAGVDPTDDAVEAYLELLSERGPLDLNGAVELAGTALQD